MNNHVMEKEEPNLIVPCGLGADFQWSTMRPVLNFRFSEKLSPGRC